MINDFINSQKWLKNKIDKNNQLENKTFALPLSNYSSNNLLFTFFVLTIYGGSL